MTGQQADQPSLPRLLGLFAHPDDEVFCIGGTFAAASQRGSETMVVSFTKGEAGQIRHADIATRATLGSTRSTELDAACRELGVPTSRCLDFADGELVNADREQLIAAAVETIRAFRPDIVYSFDETGAYGHPDHIVMSEVATAACEIAGDSNAYPGAHEPFSPGELLQARFPQNDRLLLRVLVDWLTGLDERFRATDEFTNALLMFADGTTMLGYASDHLSVEWFPKGSYIIEQGDAASSLYLVLAGSVDIVTEDEQRVQQVCARVGVGEFLGEIGIANDQVRNAHCVAAENTACFVLSHGARSPHAAHGKLMQRASIASSGNKTPEFEQIDLECDVSHEVPRKVAALAQHRSQYSITPGLFPDTMLQQLLGTEHFFRAWTAPAD